MKGPKRDAEAMLVQLLHERDTGVERPIGQADRRRLSRTLAGRLRRVEPRPEDIRSAYRDAIRSPLRSGARSARADGAPSDAHPEALLAAARVGPSRWARRLAPRSCRYHQILHAALHQAVRWQLLIRYPADAVEPPRAVRRQMPTVDPRAGPRLMAAADTTPHGVVRSPRLPDRDAPGRAARPPLVRHRPGWRLDPCPTDRAADRRSGHRLPSPEDTALAAGDCAVAGCCRSFSAGHRRPAGGSAVPRRTGIWRPRSRVRDRDRYTDRAGEPAPLVATDRRGRAGLSHLRIHDMRHAHATIMLGQGVHPKIVSERLGHASVNITLDTYSHVLPGLQAAAAAAARRRVLAEPGGRRGSLAIC